jgi:hypothetical protein
MKYYESHFEEYVQSVEKFNIHNELTDLFSHFPKNIYDLTNMVIYGPPGTGKYSQVLTLLKQYSPSKLKYDKKITANTEKQDYQYRISDIHYEVDMSLLGCTSKIVWHEVFLQIIDIISVKQDKVGIILCKNFHTIHSELLDIFYSYIQHYNHEHTNLKIIFFIITEHISFIPTTILNTSYVLNIKRPAKDIYIELCNKNLTQVNSVTPFTPAVVTKGAVENIKSIFNDLEPDGIINIKETRTFPLFANTGEIPKDNFNIICDNILEKIMDPESIHFTEFRDILYDILTYNLDTTECLWFILKYLIESKAIMGEDISDVLIKSYKFLKYYNNNYRPIYHLESMMFHIINKVHKFDAL